MSTLHFDPSAPKKATNLSINSDLLRQAKTQQWLADNAEAIAAYNERIEREGVFSDGLRRF